MPQTVDTETVLRALLAVREQAASDEEAEAAARQLLRSLREGQGDAAPAAAGSQKSGLRRPAWRRWTGRL